MNTGESFTISQPEVNLHNYIMGTPYLWYKGDMICKNQLTGDRAVINFKPKGWTSKSDYQCDGYICDDKGNKAYELFGLWSEHLTGTNTKTNQEIIFVKKKSEPENSIKQYSFTRFGISLNLLTSSMLAKIAPTDSRLRPDLRAFEFGNIELAGKEKTRLEEKQRARKKENEQKGIAHKPIWFDFSLEGDYINVKFRNQYFKIRETGSWPENTLDLFNN
jgi:hypothetical protein